MRKLGYCEIVGLRSRWTSRTDTSASAVSSKTPRVTIHITFLAVPARGTVSIPSRSTVDRAHATVSSAALPAAVEACGARLSTNQFASRRRGHWHGRLHDMVTQQPIDEGSLEIKVCLEAQRIVLVDVTVDIVGLSKTH